MKFKKNQFGGRKVVRQSTMLAHWAQKVVDERPPALLNSLRRQCVCHTPIIGCKQLIASFFQSHMERSNFTMSHTTRSRGQKYLMIKTAPTLQKILQSWLASMPSYKNRHFVMQFWPADLVASASNLCGWQEPTVNQRLIFNVTCKLYCANCIKISDIILESDSWTQLHRGQIYSTAATDIWEPTNTEN